MKINKIIWLISIACLCLLLFIIIDARKLDSKQVIFGGADGIFVTDERVYVSADYSDDSSVEETDPWPDIDIINDEEDIYSIVNDDNLLSAVYEPDVDVIDKEYVTYYGIKLRSDILPQLYAMLDACREAGYSIYVNSGYRSYSYQETIFNGVASGIAERMGITGDDAYLQPEYQLAVEEARTKSKYPGACEHQLGLAVDIVDRYYSSVSYANMNQEMFAWLDEHCCEYGFIKRYPTKKLLLTGWDESWHYRYVGVEAATYIMQHDLCYEQFYSHYVSDFTY